MGGSACSTLSKKGQKRGLHMKAKGHRPVDVKSEQTQALPRRLGSEVFPLFLSTDDALICV